MITQIKYLRKIPSLSLKNNILLTNIFLFSIAFNEKSSIKTLYVHPEIYESKIRVTGNHMTYTIDIFMKISWNNIHIVNI